MKNVLLILCSFLGSLALYAGPPAGSLPNGGKHLFILSGQSNMQGHKPEDAFTPAVQAALGAENVIVVQDAQGGQPIYRWYKDWKNPDGTAPANAGDLYARLLQKVQAATEGQKIASVSFFWMQGERDARMGWGAAYEAGLKGLVKQLEADLKPADLYVVIGRLSDYGVGNKSVSDWDVIREIQVKVAQDLPHGAWVDTDDLNDGVNRSGKRIKNDLHYSAEGYKIFGKRMADAALGMILKK